ncbi:MAG: glycosyltransferase [Solirubrobacterales bacterium]
MGSPPRRAGPPPIAYLVGRYPAASHAFLLRQVEALRARGAALETITIRSPRPEELRTAEDREAARSTYRVLPAGPLKLLGSHLPALARSPRRYFATLAYALRLGRGGARRRLWQLFYFAESMIVVRRCRRLGVCHLHAQFADTATDSALLATHFEPDWSWSIAVHGPDEFAEAADNRLPEKLASARLVIATSEHTRRRAAELLDPGEAEKKLLAVRLGVDVGRFRPPDQRVAQAPQAPLRVLCLGRLVERKAQGVLIEAVAQLAGEGTQIELTIAGEGPTRASLEQLTEALGITARVRFTGVVGQDEALRLYRACDVFCLPSLAEGLPVVLMEAMSCGLPVLSTSIDAIPELVADGENGLLVEPGDPRALADALRRLGSDPQLRSRLGRAGRATVAERFESGRQAERLLSAFAGQGLAGEAGGVGELPDTE